MVHQLCTYCQELRVSVHGLGYQYAGWGTGTQVLVPVRQHSESPTREFDFSAFYGVLVRALGYWYSMLQYAILQISTFRARFPTQLWSEKLFLRTNTLLTHS